MAAFCFVLQDPFKTKCNVEKFTHGEKHLKCKRESFFSYE